MWEYYTLAAYILGQGAPREQDGEDRDTRDAQNDPEAYIRALPQSSFSVARYFVEREAGGLNPLTQAILAGRLPPTPEDELPQARDLQGCFLNQPNSSQEKAIAIALREPLSVIKGPPGTGKSATILNLLACIRALGKTAAVVSCNHSALDAIESKLNAPPYEALKPFVARLGRQEIRRGFAQEHPRPQGVAPWFDERGRANYPGAVLTDPREGGFPILISTIHSLNACVRDWAAFQFDYVIIDESSQVNPMLGALVAASARHLVVVGDPLQLPPVVIEGDRDLLDLAAQARNVPPPYQVKPDWSFLDMCLWVLDRNDAAERCATYLDIHYRCHPGIIDFCNRHIYSDAQVCDPEQGLPERRMPLTHVLDMEQYADYQRDYYRAHYGRSFPVPIRVLWYEGDYTMPYRTAKGGRSRQNRKQITLLLEEDLPLSPALLPNGPEEVSVCCLSPYRGQIRVLSECGAFAALADNAAGEQPHRQGQNDDPTAEFIRTIHTSQGREFDIVYLLLVDDGDWEYPWSQTMYLINVAVSRAMKELRVIVSSDLMSRDLQQALTGHVIPPRTRENESNVPACRQRFVQKLLDYVAQANGFRPGRPIPVDHASPFGFHKTQLVSIFDRSSEVKEELRALLPADQQNLNDAEVRRRSGFSSGELIMTRELLNHPRLQTGEFYVFRDVPLRELLPWDPTDAEQAEFEAWQRWEEAWAQEWEQWKRNNEADISEQEREMVYLREDHLAAEGTALASFARSGPHLDLVICQKSTGRVLTAIEVDGEFHQTLRQRINDAKKDFLLSQVLGAAVLRGNRTPEEGLDAAVEGRPFALLHLATDGTTFWEVERPDLPPFPLDTFTVPQLIERFMDRAETERDCHVVMPTLSAVMEQWQQERGLERRPFPVTTVRENQASLCGILEQMGYVVKLTVPVADNAPLNARQWIPVHGADGLKLSHGLYCSAQDQEGRRVWNSILLCPDSMTDGLKGLLDQFVQG